MVVPWLLVCNRLKKEKRTHLNKDMVYLIVRWTAKAWREDGEGAMAMLYAKENGE